MPTPDSFDADVLVGPILAAVALILVLPGPEWVRRWRFLHSVPRAAMVLWQAGTIAALIAVIGSGVRAGWDLVARPPESIGWLALMLVAALFAANVVVRLGWSIITVASETGRRRSRHRAAVDVLARASAPGMRVLADPAPMAYCLPGLGKSRVVLTQGALDTLAADEVAAVLAHEWAHLRARHDVVLDFFYALHRAFPHAVRSDIALDQGRELVELLADDAARREVGAASLARALVAMAGTPVPRHALGAGGDMVRRVQRLRSEPGPPLLSVAVYGLAAGLVALPILILAL